MISSGIAQASSALPIPVLEVKTELDLLEEMGDNTPLQSTPNCISFPKVKLEEEEEEIKSKEECYLVGAPIRIEDLKMEIALAYGPEESAHSPPPSTPSTSSTCSTSSTSANPTPASMVKKENELTDETLSSSPPPSISQRGNQKDLYKLRKVRNMANPDAKNLIPAVVVPTWIGKHSVLIYRMPPDNDFCYTFQHHRTNKNNTSVYDCIQCKALKKNIQVKVVNNQFITDPATLPHSCKPVAFSDQEEFRKINEKNRNYIPRRVIREQKRDEKQKKREQRMAEKQRKRELKDYGSAEPTAPPPGRLTKRQKVIQERKLEE